ncbi:hypothetical protein FPQ18DRAFT_309013 [Pyronema domesticum]|uniref:Uncharacterized protein n=1 Tax=Pyronema omphalodes (strain CBS 100304) TaxID=1076935 RepID=U4LW35_PYROM|nr:hypothetical protein FPQ18DRAFT_309013 [Pyronema domesticum]CCX33111.1 Protein of unknown function [Pyronema omphalodes CBS 100304]
MVSALTLSVLLLGAITPLVTARLPFHSDQTLGKALGFSDPIRRSSTMLWPRLLYCKSRGFRILQRGRQCDDRPREPFTCYNLKEYDRKITSHEVLSGCCKFFFEENCKSKMFGACAGDSDGLSIQLKPAWYKKARSFLCCEKDGGDPNCHRFGD